MNSASPIDQSAILCYADRPWLWFTTYDDNRLWGPFMLCPACDRDLNDKLRAQEEADR